MKDNTMNLAHFQILEVCSSGVSENTPLDKKKAGHLYITQLNDGV